MVENVKPTDKLVFDLEMHQIDYNESKKASLRELVAKKYGVPVKNVIINDIPVTVDENGDAISLASDVVDNVQDPQFQIALFKELMEIREMKDVDFEDIKAIDSQVNAFIDFDQYSKYKTYKFKYVKWDNYLSYGGGNYFDFTKLHGLVLLNGIPENQCGKTTFAIDLLRFALFGKAEKSPTLDSVFNAYLPEETDVVVEAGIEISGTDYVIRRTVTRPSLKKRTAKSKCKQKVEYFKLVNGDYELIENCEGESGTQTNNIIRESVGNVEDFNLVISATAYSLGDLLRMGQTDKGKLFSRWLGLLSIEKKEEIAKKLWKENYQTKLLSNNYNKVSLEGEIEDYKVVIDEANKAIGIINGELNTVNDRIIALNKEKTEVASKRREIVEELMRIDVTTVETQIGMKNNELAKKRAEFNSQKDEYAEVKDAVFYENDYNNAKAEVEKLQSSVNSLENKNSELRGQITGLRKDNERIQKLIDGKVCPTCGQPVDMEMQNGLIEANQLAEQRIIGEGSLNKKKIDELNVKIYDVKTKIGDMEAQREKLNIKQKLELRMVATKSNIDRLKLEIEGLEKKKSDIETNKDKIKYNNEIDLKLQNIDISINAENSIKDQKNRDLVTYTSNINLYNNEISRRNEIIVKLKEEEKIIRNWNVYQELVGKNGIIKLVLKRALPIINNEVGRILDGLCDFKVVLDIDEKNNVVMDLYRDGQRLDLGVCASGFEGTFSSIALRTALSHIGTMPKPSFLVLDEVDSTIASVNYENLKELYRRVLCGYDFIIHIVHNEQLADMHDMTISVYKENNVSKIIMK